MRSLRASRKGSSLVLGTLLLVVVTLVAGVLFYNTVMGSVSSMTNNFNTQMSLLMTESVNINATHIVAFIRNTGNVMVEVLNAYVNNEIAILVQQVKIAATSMAPAYIRGTYTKGSTYTVKLAGLFGSLLTFQATF